MSAFIPLVPNSATFCPSFRGVAVEKRTYQTSYSLPPTRVTPSARVFQSPINVPRNGNVQDDIDFAPILEEKNAHMKFLVEPHGENFHMEASGHGNANYVATVVTNGIRFELDQVHMHSPSENHLDGKEQDLEIHLVHACGPLLCVLGVLFEIGSTSKANDELSKVIKAMKEKRENPRSEVDIDIDIWELVGKPRRDELVRFTGSLTTPPYSEGVIWVVSTKKVTASREQIDEYKALIGDDNDRPVQPLNNRPIIAFKNGEVDD